MLRESFGEQRACVVAEPITDGNVRVLIDISSLGQGGAERQVVQLATGLAGRDHTICLVVNKEITCFEDELVRSSVKVAQLRRDSALDVRVLCDLLNLVRHFDPDVVLTVSFTATLWGRFAAILDRRLVLTAEHDASERVRPAVRCANVLMRSRTAATVACARSQARYFAKAGVPAEHVVVVPNGVDLGEFHPDRERGASLRAELSIPPEAFVVGLVAGHSAVKRHGLFVRVVEALRSAGVDAYGCMFGAGPLIQETRAIVAGSPCRDRLRVVEPARDVLAAYNACDVVSLVSECEAFPLCLIEAQACGVPVVAVAAGGVSETFLPGRTGILVHSDDPLAVAGALRALAEDGELRAVMGRRGRAWVKEHLSVDRMVDGYESLFLRVLRERSVRYVGWN